MQQQIPGIDPHLLYFLPFFALFGMVMSIVLVIPYWMIFKKAGFSPWLSLLFFVPLANVIVLYVVAFSRWNVVPVRDITPQYGATYPASPATYPAPQPTIPPQPPQYRG